MVSKLLFVLAVSGSALADFWIGNCASHDAADKNEIALPGETLDCNYKAFPDSTNICDATTLIDTSNNGGVCPGNDDNRSLNFCGVELRGSGCPSSFQISNRDDCGDVALKDQSLPDDGFFYGDLIDTAKNNIAVGRCVYEGTKDAPANCTSGGEESTCAKFIRCYTGMYGSGEYC